MAIVLEANYAKKLGLPNFSSHQYSVTIRTELVDLSQVEQESARLYSLLQDAVDREIQEVGFMPDATRYGMNNGAHHETNGHAPAGSTGGNGNGRANGANGSNGHTYPATNGNGTNGFHSAPADGDRWNCTDGQKGFILRLVNESKLEKQDVEELAVKLFGAGVKQLNKLQASQLLEELLEKTGRPAGDRRAKWTNRTRS